MKFSPCQGGDSCTQDGSHCQGCGRSHTEIAATREVIDAIAQFALTMGYDNLEEFAMFVSAKAAGRARLLRMQRAGA